MSPQVTTNNGVFNGSSTDKAEKNAVSSDTNITNAASAGATGTGNSRSSMKVQDFMSYLAKEANITNMTVETNDGRRISATFKNGLPTGISTPRSGSPISNSLKSSSALVKDDPSGGRTEDKTNGGNGEASLMSPTRDIATTMAMMGAKKTSPSTLPTPAVEAYASPEWAINYQNKHVAVTYSNVEIGAESSLKNGNVLKINGTSAVGVGTTSLPPKKRASVKTEDTSESSWNAMSALVDAATVAQREHEQVPPGALGVSGSASAKVATALAMGANMPTTAFKKKPTKRKPRKIIPEIKEYVEFTQKDVLFGRGGRSNHHPGNKTYRDIVTKQQNHYRGCDKNEKTKVAQGIVDHIQNVVGGRFLELDRDIKRWFLVPNVVARRKVGQALRENNTEEARAAKRAKYQGRLNSKKKNFGDAVGASSGNDSAPMITMNSGHSNASIGAMNDTSNNVTFPKVANEVATDAYPIDDAERVAV